MKKNVRVIITKEFEIDIDDSHLTEESLKEFSSCIFKADIDGLFKYTARKCFSEDSCFVEGIGEATSIYYKKEENTMITFNCIYEYSEEEFV